MKIRTDFVTNSSSSSFTVQIAIIDKNGKKYDGFFAGDEDGMTSLDLNCTTKEIMNSDSVDSLLELLSNSLNTDCNYDDPYFYEFKEEFKAFADEISKNVVTIDDIDTILIKRTLEAWGEYASCFVWNVNSYAPELISLAQKVCNASDKEKESAKKALFDYLNNCDLKINDPSWPSGFAEKLTGQRPISRISGDATTDIESFAKAILEQDLPMADVDWGEETVKIDMKSKKQYISSEYIISEDDNSYNSNEPDDMIEVLSDDVENSSIVDKNAIIRFGKYDWKPLATNGKLTLLFLNGSLGKLPYQQGGGDITWEECTLREYLNNDFYNSFLPEEKEKIVETTIKNNDTKSFDELYGLSIGGHDTVDKIFLLSIEDVDKYFEKTKRGVFLGSWFYSETFDSDWLLRSPGHAKSHTERHSKHKDNYVAIARSDGFIDKDGKSARSKFDIRPAMWVRL